MGYPGVTRSRDRPAGVWRSAARTVFAASGCFQESNLEHVRGGWSTPAKSRLGRPVRGFPSFPRRWTSRVRHGLVRQTDELQSLHEYVRERRALSTALGMEETIAAAPANDSGIPRPRL
jgi:hypothetical protein